MWAAPLTLLSLVSLSGLSFGFLVSADDDQIKITTTLESGAIRGKRSVVNGKSIDTFYGIPYAKPPIGDLRFKPPEPVAPWSGVRDANTPGSRCIQIDYPGGPTGPQNEDCLFINVFSPNATVISNPLPVMVWIHGGTYRTGQGDIYNGAWLASKGVVLVNFNYRLDALGFMSTEDQVMPGNYGMLDQIAALKWVKANIAAFGGDPKKVTVFGESAGATSVSLLLLSPLAEGLFHGAIMESGTSLCLWAYATPSHIMPPRLATKLIGAQVGCTSSDSSEQLKCLQSVDASRLVNESQTLTDLAFQSAAIMYPRVESTYGFLPDLPYRLLESGKFHHVNTIRGYNENESGFFADFNVLQNIAGLQMFKHIAAQTYSLYTIGPAYMDQLLTDLEGNYLQNITSTDGPLAYAKALDRLSTDYFFRASNMAELKMASKASKGEKSYQYKFAVRPERSTQPEWITAIHTDELQYVFGAYRDFASPSHQAVIDQIMTLWTNFAKTGDPNRGSSEDAGSGNVVGSSKWEAYDDHGQNMLLIKEGGATMEKVDMSVLTSYFSSFMRRANFLEEKPSCPDVEQPSQAVRLNHPVWCWLPALLCGLFYTSVHVLPH